LNDLLALLQILTYFMLLVLAGYLLNRGAYHSRADASKKGAMSDNGNS
jgi:hypothetical protein